MINHWLYAATVGPLGLYFWVLAVWNSDRHPRVVSGLLDFALLWSGVGGVLVFGPFGRWLVRTLFDRPGLMEWLTILSGMVLLATMAARQSLARVVIYHVDRATIHDALAEILAEHSSAFRPTLQGFENPSSGTILKLDMTPIFRAGVVEVHGPHREVLAQLLRCRLGERMRTRDVGPSRYGWVLYGLSLVVMLTPLLAALVSERRALEALRGLLQRWAGG